MRPRVAGEPGEKEWETRTVVRARSHRVCRSFKESRHTHQGIIDYRRLNEIVGKNEFVNFRVTSLYSFGLHSSMSS